MTSGKTTSWSMGFNLVNRHADLQPPAQEVPSYVHHEMWGVGHQPAVPVATVRLSTKR
ncbi:hypothetical protein [Mycolicibacterium sp. XJ883]